MAGNWQYYGFKLLSKCISAMPYSWVISGSRLLGKAYYRIAVKQRLRALDQIRAGMNLKDEEADRIIRAMFRNIAQNFMEVLYTPALLQEPLEKHFVFDDLHYLEEALAINKGVIFLTGHVGNWEWLGASLAQKGFPMTSVVRRQPNDQHTRILNEYREKAGIEVFASGGNEMVGAAKAIKKRKILGFLSDMDGGVNGIFVEFFGRMASSPQGVASFARKFGSPIVPVFIVHRPEGGHRILVRPYFFYEDTGNEKQDMFQTTLRATREIEKVIREHPEEWIWFIKRWHTPYREQSLEEETGKERTDEADDNQDAV